MHDLVHRAGGSGANLGLFAGVGAACEHGGSKHDGEEGSGDKEIMHRSMAPGQYASSCLLTVGSRMNGY